MISRKQIDLLAKAALILREAQMLVENDNDDYAMFDVLQDAVSEQIFAAEDVLREHAHDNAQFGMGA